MMERAMTNAIDNQFRARAMTRIACANQARRINVSLGPLSAYGYLRKHGFSEQAASYIVFGV